MSEDTREEIGQHESGDGVANEIDVEKAQKGARLILEAVGQDPDADKLVETWQRRVPETLVTLTAGYREGEKPDLTTFEAETDSLIIKTGIPIYSLCEHHLLPYYGVAHVCYRPTEEVVGLSKLPRYIRWQARRLTMQEELTQDIAVGLREELDAAGVIVQITATHLCEAMRGVETATNTTTQAVYGEPTDDDQRQFQTAINNHDY